MSRVFCGRQVEILWHISLPTNRKMVFECLISLPIKEASRFLERFQSPKIISAYDETILRICFKLFFAFLLYVSLIFLLPNFSCG